jgi:glycerol-3-phosphate dehydrogenase (NAD(P)+)
MKITILGAGNWGTALGLLLAEKGNEVILWEFFAEQAEQLKQERENRKFLPGFPFPENIHVTSSLEKALSEPEMAVFAVPSHTLRSVAEHTGKHLAGSPVLVSVVKGIEKDTLKRMSEVISENVPLALSGRVVALSGPSIAHEVIRRIPTTVVAACGDVEIAAEVQRTFSTSSFRVYSSLDILGVELGGAVKNVIVIAAGICDGMGLGANTKAALLTRGLAEIKRLGLSMGAREETFSGLSGMGDLITTAFSAHSRNRHVGEELGKGRRLEEILGEMVMVAEGVKTTQSVMQLAQAYGVDMPITREVHQVLFEGKSPEQGVRDLMKRELKKENW